MWYYAGDGGDDGDGIDRGGEDDEQALYETQTLTCHRRSSVVDDLNRECLVLLFGLASFSALHLSASPQQPTSKSEPENRKSQK